MLSAETLDRAVASLVGQGYAVVDGAFGVGHARGALLSVQKVRSAGALRPASRKWIRTDQYAWDYEVYGGGGGGGGAVSIAGAGDADLQPLIDHQDAMTRLRLDLDQRLDRARREQATPSSSSRSNGPRTDAEDGEGEGLPVDRRGTWDLPSLAEQTSTMMAVYSPGGAGYQNHVDASEEDVAGFVLTLVYYLNANWTAADGGALRLTPRRSGGAAANKEERGGMSGGANEGTSSSSGSDQEQEQAALEILPLEDRLVIFLSARTFHQVLPTTSRDRYALQVWFRHGKAMPITPLCRIAALKPAGEQRGL